MFMFFVSTLVKIAHNLNLDQQQTLFSLFDFSASVAPSLSLFLSLSLSLSLSQQNYAEIFHFFLLFVQSSKIGKKAKYRRSSKMSAHILDVNVLEGKQTK